METDALLRAQITKGWSGGRKGAEPALCLPTHPQAHLKKKKPVYNGKCAVQLLAQVPFLTVVFIVATVY